MSGFFLFSFQTDLKIFSLLCFRCVWISIKWEADDSLSWAPEKWILAASRIISRAAERTSGQYGTATTTCGQVYLKIRVKIEYRSFIIIHYINDAKQLDILQFQFLIYFQRLNLSDSAFLKNFTCPWCFNFNKNVFFSPFDYTDPK